MKDVVKYINNRIKYYDKNSIYFVQYTIKNHQDLFDPEYGQEIFDETYTYPR